MTGLSAESTQAQTPVAPRPAPAPPVPVDWVLPPLRLETYNSEGAVRRIAQDVGLLPK